MRRRAPADSMSGADDLKAPSPPTKEVLFGVRVGAAAKLVVCAAGILVCYFYYGIVQERITKSKYGEEGERFVYTQSLVFVQCVVNALFAFAAGRVGGGGGGNKDDTPTEMYALCAFSYLAAMIASNHSLQFVAYPTQVLGKSVKPIPIMIFGVLFARKRYPLVKYGFVLLIVAGVALFLYKEPPSAASAASSTAFDVGWGELLLLLSLCMDGTTGAVQDRIRASYTSKANDMMFSMNLWSTLYLSVGLVLTGELFAFLGFVATYSSVLVHMVLFSVASALGQYFIFVTVADFGPLTCSIVTTTRKFFTIMASVIFFQNPLSQRQWIGAVFVFVGLSLDSAFGKPKRPPQSQHR